MRRIAMFFVLALLTSITSAAYSQSQPSPDKGGHECESKKKETQTS